MTEEKRQMNNMSKESLGNEAKQSIVIQKGLFDYPVGKGQYPSLLGNRCSNCDKRFFPKRILCPYCFEKGNMEDVELDRFGIIYACTLVHITSPSGIKAPYAYGYVDIPADKIRVFGLFTGADPFSFHAGQKVELVLEPIRTNKEGLEVIGHKFKPVE
jgi:uncharacterized OB-fold protein